MSALEASVFRSKLYGNKNISSKTISVVIDYRINKMFFIKLDMIKRE